MPDGVSCTSDILGNRLTFGTKSYSWDQLNRMTSYNGSTSHSYRAGGMRVYKSSSSGATSYRYDGQMGMEDIDSAGGSVQKVTDYGVGARGIDAIYVTQNGSTAPSYPIYDAHGNMIATLARNGSGYSTANLRTFDAWGIVRVGAQTGDPKGRYCANLGHKQDDESGLVYMRARYYEPGSGRFLSEDSASDGTNWFAYCHNDPTNLYDSSGKDALTYEYGQFLIVIGLIMMLTAGFSGNSNVLSDLFQAAKLTWNTFSTSLQWANVGAVWSEALGGETIGTLAVLKSAIQSTYQILGETEALAAMSGIASRAVIALGGYALACLGYWLDTQ